ncbi:MAG: zinc ABC transporter substrate-binding protein, partial [Deltaproteobacteria bacterium]|nr:zinc ABC transporter substrate-binding protein [Deltaproteobacteria bacterium]
MRTALPMLAFFVFLVLPAPAAAAPVAVTVSIPPQKYFVEKIGGDAVSVTVMTAKGQDPHSYEPTAAQMEGISRAELYFTIGVPFETQWVPKFRSLNPTMLVVDLLRA